MIEVGRLCVKTAGRDAMQLCVVVEEVDEKFVLVDGNTRRKKVNKLHVEPLDKKLDIKKGADSKAVKEAFEKAEIPLRNKGEPRKPKAQESKKTTTIKSNSKKNNKAKSKEE